MFEVTVAVLSPRGHVEDRPLFESMITLGGEGDAASTLHDDQLMAMETIGDLRGTLHDFVKRSQAGTGEAGDQSVAHIVVPPI